MNIQRVAQREHFGQGSLAIDPSKSVFINCPYDPEYRDLFEAILFSTVCCGFLPRCALETGSVARPRMERITDAIFSSKYSIHDLSRCRGEGNEGLARFNMPLELGIAIAHQFTSKDILHDWLVLVPKGHPYIRYVSDLAGYDPMTHEETVETVIPNVITWLATRPDATKTPTPKQVLDVFPSFKRSIARLATDWLEQTPWADLVLAARKNVPDV